MSRSGPDPRPPGPGAALWYAAGDLRVFLFAVRALVLQVAHPMVGAAVLQQSVYKDDPYGRLWRSSLSVTRQIYGGARTADEGRRLLEMHKQIKGVDDDGRRYHALDPEAFMWVHATMFELYRMLLRDLGPGLDAAEEQQLFDEWHRVGRLIGVRPSVLPGSIDDFDAMWARMLPRLENNPVVQDLLHAIPKRPPYTPIPQPLFDRALRPMWRRQRDLLAVTLDPELRARIGIAAPDRRTRRRVRRTFAVARTVGNRLPDLLRLAPLSQLAIRRVRRDGRTLPEPVAYPRPRR